MKSKWFPLLKARVITQFSLNDYLRLNDPKKRLNKWVLTITILWLIGMLSFYCGISAYGMVKNGLGEIIPIYAVTLISLMNIFFTMFKANGELFAFKDYDLVMSLPVKTSTVIFSRFMTLYIWNTFFSIMIMGPMAIVYLISYKPGAAVYIMWVLGVLTVSLIPTTIAAIIGAVITALASRFRNSNKAISILSFAAFIVFFLFTMRSGQQEVEVERMLNMVAVMSEQLGSVYPIGRLFQAGILHGDVAMFSAYLGISILWYWLFVQILSYKYKWINSKVTSYHMKGGYVVKGMQQNSALSALYKNELSRYFSTSIYLINTMFGAVMGVIVSISLILAKDKIILATPGGEETLKMALPLVLAAIIGTTCTTCIALSIEGKNLWIIKSLPLEPKVIYDSKILVNLTLCVPSAIISGIFSIIAMKADLWTSGLLLLIPLIFSFLIAVYGVFINNRLPRYDWDTETQLVKQSLPAMLGFLGIPLISALLIALVIMLKNSLGVDSRITMSCIAVLGALITIFLYNGESKRKIK